MVKKGIKDYSCACLNLQNQEDNTSRSRQHEQPAFGLSPHFQRGTKRVTLPWKIPQLSPMLVYAIRKKAWMYESTMWLWIEKCQLYPYLSWTPFMSSWCSLLSKEYKHLGLKVGTSLADGLTCTNTLMLLLIDPSKSNVQAVVGLVGHRWSPKRTTYQDILSQIDCNVSSWSILDPQ